ncbi:hypothetical protein BDR07DRAFT_1490604 [Suillus spraguei]|nr:hypothetical protein BDR07DRAFT_1490604 [Suillus spraguei]
MPPRFKYNLQGLDPKEQQTERKRIWLARQMQDPEGAERIRAQNRASKRAQRHREKMLKILKDSESSDQGAEPPRFRRKRPENTASEGPSIQHPITVARTTSINDSLIDPVLRNPIQHRRMADANVMTDPPQCIPDTPYPLFPPSLDFISGILGVEVPEESGTVTWADGRRTVLPCVMSEGINICEDNDAAMVRFLSKFPESKPSSNNVVHLNHVAKRVNNFTYPHKQGTIQQFLDDIINPSKIQCILDLPLSHVGLPPELQLLDHGLVYGWNQTTVDCPVRSGKVHPDNFTTKSWALLHHAGFVSYPHHDSDGAMTFVRIETGIKFWILFANFAKNQEEILFTWDAEVITLLDGDMLFQPAGQVHAVYTPKKSFITGGHFYNFGSLHLTEMSRYIDAHKAQFLTNQVHDNALETFQRMMIALPRLPPSFGKPSNYLAM